jgi:hypothetical protein
LRVEKCMSGRNRSQLIKNRLMKEQSKVLLGAAGRNTAREDYGRMAYIMHETIKKGRK